MAQTLETVIAINAKTGNGFSQVGATLAELGSMVDGWSQKLIDFGKDSVEVYRNYEKSMSSAEVALSTTYGKNSADLQGVMNQLGDAATEWAATTIFHTNDVADAISEAAHAGWDAQQIMAGIPAAMQLAEAGGLDLSDSVNYIVKATTAAGVSFEDLGDFVDEWAFASNSSASNIQEFGDAMLRMGGTMKFAGDTKELMTMLATTADAGNVGQEAGTMIRNSMLRLIAPTKKAKKAMAELGATSDEAAGLMDDEALAAANARLEAAGFSAYDEQGNLKPILDDYRDLYVALGNIAGGYDNIAKNKDALEILYQIFPTRTITEALAMLQGVEDNYGGLYEKMANGEAKGYGEYASETMMDTLNGRIEIFKSKVERLQQVVGKSIDPQLSTLMEVGGDFIDKIAGLDEGNMNALVSGLETIALTGPALGIASTAMRMIGHVVANPAVGLGMLTVAAVSAYNALQALNEAEYESAFGTNQIDQQEIANYTGQIADGYDQAWQKIDQFRQGVEDAQSAYETASSKFNSELLTNLITGATLSPEDQENLMNLGNEMGKAVKSGIEQDTAGSMDYFELLFGGEGAAELSPDYNTITELKNSSYEQAISNCEQIGKDLRNALADAFKDGTISDEEYANIQNYIRAYNEAISQASQEEQDRQLRVETNKALLKAQNASLDSVEETADQIIGTRDEQITKQEDAYYSEYAKLQDDIQQAQKNGTVLESLGRVPTDADAKQLLQDVTDRYNTQQSQTRSTFDRALSTMWDQALLGSDYGDTYKGLGTLADQVMSGKLGFDEAYSRLQSQYGSNYHSKVDEEQNPNSDRSRISDTLSQAISDMGGAAAVATDIQTLNKSGDTETASQLTRMLMMDALNNHLAVIETPETKDLKGIKDLPAWIDSAFGGDATGLYSGLNNAYLGAWGKLFPNANITSQAQSMAGVTQQQAPAPAGNTTTPEVKAPQQPATNTTQTETAESEISGNVTLQKSDVSYEGDPIEIPALAQLEAAAQPVSFIQAPVEGFDKVTQLQNQGVKVDVDGDTQQIEAKIDGQNGQQLLEYVDGDATNLSMSISDQDGKTLRENVTGDASSLARIINSYNGKVITVNILGRKLFASGGRATEASTFAEAGPEWAIPEKHDENTAALLDAARAASGFSWGEIISRFGGLNADPSGPAKGTLIYSPTIHAENADGVDRVLKDDKDRLDDWYRNKQMHDSMEVYA